MNNTRVARRSPHILTAFAASIALVFVLAACGAEGTGSATAVETPDGAAAVNAAAPVQTTDSAPSEAFCNGYADFVAAQDGAQRNTAIGEMQAALSDPSGEVGQALDTLLTGDLEPSEYAAAEAVLADYAQDCPTPDAPQRPTG